MKEKKHLEQNVCPFILDQLQAKTGRILSGTERSAFLIYCDTLSLFATSALLGISRNKTRLILKDVFRKVKLNKTDTVFDSKEDFLTAPLILHGFSPRLYNKLRELECKNLNDVLEFKPENFLCVRGFGKGMRTELDLYLEKYLNTS